MKASAFALRGIADATARFEASAARAARMGDPAAETDLPKEVVEQISAKAAFSANLRVLETSNAVTKQLLDLKV